VRPVDAFVNPGDSVVLDPTSPIFNIGLNIVALRSLVADADEPLRDGRC
jgi:hypothetical protein